MRKLLLVCALVLGWASAVEAVCAAGCTNCVAPTLSQSDVATCVTNAATSGATITLPSGTASSWSTVTINKALTMMGATTGCPTACVNNTTINGGSSSAFLVTADNVRISGITFTGAGSDYGMISVYTIGLPSGNEYGPRNFRIDHNHFNGITNRAIVVGRMRLLADSNQRIGVPGLIDNNRFTNAADAKAIQLYGGGGDPAYSSWMDTLTLGGPSFVFIEDNVFSRTSLSDSVSTIDHDSGGRSVIRFNSFAFGRVTYHGQELQGDPSGNPWRSTHGWENYNNTFTGDGYYRRIDSRGGTGMFFANTFTGAINGHPINYYYDRGDLSRACLLAGACQGSSSYDGNETGKFGYPCFNQPGMTGSTGITKKPIYHFRNSWNGDTTEANLSSIQYNGECNYQHVQFGRDVIFGTSGTTLPSTCTTNAGFWKTNEGYWNSKTPGTAAGVFYKCTNTTTPWTLHYVPYLYPHPLRSGLSAPTGLTVE